MGTNAYIDIEVARHPAALAMVGRISLAAETDAGPIVYAGGNVQLNILGDGDIALALAA